MGHLRPRNAWHLDVKKDEVGMARGDEQLPLLSIACHANRVPGALEQVREQPREFRIVIDEEQVSHDLYSGFASTSRPFSTRPDSASGRCTANVDP